MLVPVKHVREFLSAVGGYMFKLARFKRAARVISAPLCCAQTPRKSGRAKKGFPVSAAEGYRLRRSFLAAAVVAE